MPTAFYRHFESIDALGLALVDESFTSLRAMLRDVRRNGPAFADIIDNSLQVLVEHVHAQRDHFQFIARERAAGPIVVREAIAQQIELIERELAADLAGLPGPERWSAGDLHVLANLIVSPVVATAENDPRGRPRRRGGDRGARPHPAQDGPDRRAQLALPRLTETKGAAATWPRPA